MEDQLQDMLPSLPLKVELYLVQLPNVSSSAFRAFSAGAYKGQVAMAEDGLSLPV